VSGNGTGHPSSGFTPGNAGDYWWFASYDGDSNNGAATATCGASMAETIVAQADPNLSASGPSSGTAGSAIASSGISASLSGGSAPTGTVSFTVFGPQSSAPTSCTSGGATVGTATVSDNGTQNPSAGFTPPGAGNYWWYAGYGGDFNNNGSNSECGAGMAETVVGAAPAPPTISPPTISIGSPITGQRLNRLQAVVARYSCQDAAGAPGIASCAGTVANGSPIDTSTLGSHAFTVTVQSKDGQSTTETVHYTVKLPSDKSTVSRVLTYPNGSVTFDLTLPGPGAIDVFESAWDKNIAIADSLIQPAPSRFVFARNHIDVHHSGTVHVVVPANSHGDELVDHHRFVWIRVWLSYTPTGGRQRNQLVGFLHLTR
jgi:hypothetical protein